MGIFFYQKQFTLIATFSKKNQLFCLWRPRAWPAGTPQSRENMGGGPSLTEWPRSWSSRRFPITHPLPQTLKITQLSWPFISRIKVPNEVDGQGGWLFLKKSRKKTIAATLSASFSTFNKGQIWMILKLMGVLLIFFFEKSGHESSFNFCAKLFETGFRLFDWNQLHTVPWAAKFTEGSFSVVARFGALFPGWSTST